MKKAQMAMEFLFSYSWAILAVMLTIVALTYFGVIRTDKFVPEACIIAPGITCESIIANNGIRILIKNILPYTMSNVQISTGSCNSLTPITIDPGEAEYLDLSCSLTGHNYKSDFIITYDEQGLSKSKTGILSGIIQQCISDQDNDKICDNNDNCLLIANSNQIDVDNDLYGNRCDPDFDNNNVVGISDLGVLRGLMGITEGNPGYDPLYDLDSNGAIGISDMGILRSFMGLPPGPSGRI